MKVSALVALYLLGQTRATRRRGGVEQRCPIQPRPLYVLAYLALNWQRAHRREELQALFWPDKSPKAAANNLHQALWHLRQALPSATLCQDGDCARWNPSAPPWVDALAFETALDSGDMDAALSLYTGALLPDCYDEWAQLERERLRLRYLTALETRAHQQYQARGWDAARSDASTLLADDPLNEAAVRLALACHWALNQRESARRLYDAYRQRVRAELHTDPLPETTMLYQRILRGEAHPDQSPTCDDATTAAQAARFSLLETLGAFRQGLEQATTWVAQADAATRAEALRWQGVFYLRLGKLADARAALIEALALTPSSPRQVVILSILATTETGLGEYASAEAHFTQALHFAPLDLAVRVRLLSALGGLQGRMGHHAAARRVLEEAVSLARALGNSAPLAMTSGNLGILLLGQRETTAAERALREALAAARQADAHWLTAHIQGHLGVLDQDRGDYESAAHNYLDARALTEAIGDQRANLLWTLNLGIVRYEQARYAEAMPLLTDGQARAVAQGSKSLEAGAHIFIGACLVAQDKQTEGLESIERGLALARSIRDQERILIGLLHQGRALIALGRTDEARATLQDGLRQAEVSQMHRLGEYLRAELQRIIDG